MGGVYEVFFVGYLKIRCPATYLLFWSPGDHYLLQPLLNTLPGTVSLTFANPSAVSIEDIVSNIVAILHLQALVILFASVHSLL